MDILYFETAEGNFGDDLNDWLWDALLPGVRGWDHPGTILGVGTILKRGFVPEGAKLVLGSGVGYGSAPDITRDGPWDVRAVRGPLTAEALGLPPEKAITDGAVMLPLLPEFQDIPRTDEVVFIPHYKSVPLYDWPEICARAGVSYQTPSADSKDVIRRIAGAGRVIGESMHAAIIADAFGTPWRGVEITAGFNHFKWTDWAQSLGMEAPGITRFFGPLRQAQDIVRSLKGGKAKPATAPEGPQTMKTGTKPAEHQPVASGVSKLMPVLQPWAVQTLKAETRKPFALSDRDRLAAAQARFRAMLDGVIADYGSGTA